MLAVLVVHAIAAALAPALIHRWGRRAFYLLAVVPAAALLWVIPNWPQHNQIPTVTIAWVPELSLNIALRFDSLAAVMSVIILGIGALVLFYCASYFHSDDGHTVDRLPSFAAELVAFCGAMFGLVVSDNMVLLYVFWEITTVLSFLLVGFYARQAISRRAAVQALLVTTAGGLAMLVGIIIVGHTAGSYLLSDVVNTPPQGTTSIVGIGLILIGAVSKSALVPFHFWLPGAMAAPTPVSAYLHAAAMVKAGVYLIARLTPGFADSPGWRPLLITLGVVTMLLAGWRACREYDLKLILAYGTVSQLGFITVMVGGGDQDLMVAGLAMLCAHALFKAALFMTVGVIDHVTGTRDIRKLTRLGRQLPAVCVIAAAATASMVALPPFLGFVAKEADFETIYHSASLGSWAPVILGGVVIGSVFTTVYSLRFLWGAFADKKLPNPHRSVVHALRPSRNFLVAPAILATLGGIGGIGAGNLGNVLNDYAADVPAAGATDGHDVLALWHGFGVPLFLSVFVLVAGITMFVMWERFSHTRIGSWAPLNGAERVYGAILRGADNLSVRLTAVTQRGSIPVSQAITLTTLVLFPITALLVGARDKPRILLWDSLIQPLVGILIVAAGISAIIVRNRLAVVLLVGVTGYGCGIIFTFYGAPDLALTQFLVETMILVIFVLVLRTFPAEVHDATERRYQLSKALLSLAVGTAVSVLALFAITARTTTPIAEILPDAAYFRGYGANTVNVLLVDIRAWDTLGEISVLVTAATGVASLVFRHRRFGAAPRVPDNSWATKNSGTTDNSWVSDISDTGAMAAIAYSPAAGDTTWLRGSHVRDPRLRSLVLEVATRMIFPLMMVVSAYFFFTGHNTPGGGFAGGLTAGLALVLRYLAGGRYELGETLPLDAGKILGTGLVFSAGTAVASILLGAPALSSAVIEMHLPVLGTIKFVTSLFFDLGVYLIVVGLVLDVLRSLGARIDEESTAAKTTQTVTTETGTR